MLLSFEAASLQVSRVQGEGQEKRLLSQTNLHHNIDIRVALPGPDHITPCDTRH